jgi:site-specific recombinase XerD
MTDLKDPGAGPEISTSLTIIEPATGLPVPAMIAAAGERASLRFIDFFTAHIRNPNTRGAYGVAVRSFFAWLELQDLAELSEIRTHHVSTYTELLTRNYSAPTVKQHLAAIRKLFDWLIIGQVIDQNPAAPVRGPTHIVKKGKTSVLLADEARQLLDSIKVVKTVKLPDGSTAEKPLLVGLRDRALIALLIYSFARISAALQMNVDDYYPQGKRWWVRLHEKGGKEHEMPAHHLLEQYLDTYVTAAGIAADKNAPLFRTIGGCERQDRGQGRGRKQLTSDRMTRQDARRMIKRRARKAGLLTRISCHSFRATGITVYLLNGGLLEYAQQMAAHESARTTKLYDRRNDQVTLDQVERIVL